MLINCFILVSMNLEAITGTLGASQGYTLEGMPVYRRGFF